MGKESIISLIENGDLHRFDDAVFRNFAYASGDGCYTMPLSPGEEKALIKRAFECGGGWYVSLKNYMRHYPLTSSALDYLLLEPCEKTVEIVTLQYSLYGYSLHQAEQTCLAVKKNPCGILRPLAKAVCDYVRIYEEDIFRLLTGIDLSIHEKTSEDPGYAALYAANAKKRKEK